MKRLGVCVVKANLSQMYCSCKQILSLQTSMNVTSICYTRWILVKGLRMYSFIVRNVKHSIVKWFQIIVMWCGNARNPNFLSCHICQSLPLYLSAMHLSMLLSVSVVIFLFVQLQGRITDVSRKQHAWRVNACTLPSHIFRWTDHQTKSKTSLLSL